MNHERSSLITNISRRVGWFCDVPRTWVNLLCLENEGLPFICWTFHSYRWFLKPCPNDRNISTQHITTSNWVQHVAYVWPPCCDVLQHVVCCWLKFETGQIFYTTFVDVAWCYGCLARFVQQWCARACALARFSTRNMSQHLTTGWPNALNTLLPTMLRSVVFKCCDRLPELATTGKHWDSRETKFTVPLGTSH